VGVTTGDQFAMSHPTPAEEEAEFYRRLASRRMDDRAYKYTDRDWIILFPQSASSSIVVPLTIALCHSTLRLKMLTAFSRSLPRGVVLKVLSSLFNTRV